jgi:hypothetical protein
VPADSGVPRADGAAKRKCHNLHKAELASDSDLVARLQPNQLRLIFPTAAYWLLRTIRARRAQVLYAGADGVQRAAPATDQDRRNTSFEEPHASRPATSGTAGRCDVHTTLGRNRKKARQIIAAGGSIIHAIRKSRCRAE